MVNMYLKIEKCYILVQYNFDISLITNTASQCSHTNNNHLFIILKLKYNIKMSVSIMI